MYASGYATPPPTHPPVCHNDAKCDAGGPLNPSTKQHHLSLFSAEPSHLRCGPQLGTDSWLLADHPRKQRKTVQGSMLVQALPAWTGGCDYP